MSLYDAEAPAPAPEPEGELVVPDYTAGTAPVRTPNSYSLSTGAQRSSMQRSAAACCRHAAAHLSHAVRALVQGGPTSMGSEPAAPAAGGVACPATITLITINPDPNAVRNAHASTAERRLR